jgi:hypothetical protein
MIIEPLLQRLRNNFSKNELALIAFYALAVYFDGGVEIHSATTNH